MNIQDLRNNGRVHKKAQVRNPFKGFNSKKLFYLTDGSAWIQKVYKYWYYYAHRPNVTIYEYGNQYYITVDGQNEFIEVKKASSVSRHTIVSDFKGWKSGATFKMDNGEIWEQAESEYDYNYSYRPDAIIYSDGWSYRLEVEGKSVEVKRK